MDNTKPEPINLFIEQKNMEAESGLVKMEEEEDAAIQGELDAINEQNKRKLKLTRERMRTEYPDKEPTIDLKPKGIQLNFHDIHAKFTLELETAGLSPTERYSYLVEKNEEAKVENNEPVLLAIHEAMEQIDHKELGLENWEKFYKEEYNKKEEEQKGKGCNYLAEEEEDISHKEPIDLHYNQIDAIQRVRRQINASKKEGEEECHNMITSLNTHKKMASWDEDDYDEQLESTRRGLGGVDESKGDVDRRCDKENISYNNHKRLFYLKMTMDDKEYEKLTNQQKKEKLAALKERIKTITAKNLNKQEEKLALKKLGWEIKYTDRIPFKKNFERMYKEKPSLKDFKEADDVIQKKCPNIFELNNFIPDDPSEMGGHPGAFINIYMPSTEDGKDDCQIWGGKKWVKDSRTEYNFYEYLHKNQDTDIFKSFKKYIPIFKDEMGRCLPYQPNSTAKAKKKMHYYIPMNNLHNSVRVGTEEVNNLDIKLGFRTSFVHEKGVSGNNSNLKRDVFQSNSSKIGFRLEGSNLKNRINEISHTQALESGWHETPLEGEMGTLAFKIKPVATKAKISYRDIKTIKKNFKLDQYQLYILNPGFIFDTFFYNTSNKYIDDFERKLIEFENNFIKKNFEAFETENSPAIAFIGCSIFIVNGSGGIDFKFMDFAHPYVLSWNIKNASGDKELSKNGEICCPTNMATGEPIENLNSFNNQLGYKDTYKNKWPNADDPDDEKVKKDITYDEWSHVFQNFMASLISFVYSFRLWKNSRKYYKTPNTKKKNDKELYKSYSEYNKHFDKTDSRLKLADLSTDKDNDKMVKQDPYFWTQDKKIPMWHNLQNKSQSNLMNILLLK